LRLRVAVVGGGISGLTLAYELVTRSGEVDVVCLEAGPRAGGNVGTLREGGFVCEWGPTGFLDDAPATLDLVRRLGLTERVLPCNLESATRFLYHRGKLRRLAPATFLTSELLSLGGRLRLLAEPFRGRGLGDADESIAAFASRRLGPEATAVLVDAMVGGIYAGDIRGLSLRATFPKLWELERDHGSLVRGMLARSKRARTGGGKRERARLTSFRTGLAELTDALHVALGERLRLASRVTRVTGDGRGGFRLGLADAAPLEADAVVLACPAWAAAPILRELDAPLAAAVSEIPSAPVVVVHLGFEARALGDRRRGFGYLVPSAEGLRTLGTLWTSDIFAERAPAGSVLLTSMLGGARDPGVIDLTDDQAQALALRELKPTMGIATPPTFVRVVKHARGIPQYTLGHPARLATIDERLRGLPRLHLAGNSYRGISINACIEEAQTLSAKILERVRG
jgi:oxygen-dependent protoporphyrinogen oxidase